MSLFDIKLTNLPVIFVSTNRKNCFPKNVSEFLCTKKKTLMLIFSITFSSSHKPTFYTKNLIVRILFNFFIVSAQDFWAARHEICWCGTRQNFIQTPFLHKINCYEKFLWNKLILNESKISYIYFFIHLTDSAATCNNGYFSVTCFRR